MQSITINITPLRHVVVFHMPYVNFVFVSHTFTGSTLHVSNNPIHSRQSECTDSSFINIAYRFVGCEILPDDSC